MLYLEKFLFPDLENDNLYFDDPKGSFYDEHTYPFHLTSEMSLWSIDFEPITILYGGNGSGKSTIINVISEKLRAERMSMFNSSPYFDEYVKRCQYKANPSLAGETISSKRRKQEKYDISQITTVLTSDDIFHSMQELRLDNDRKLQKSRFLMDEYVCPEELPTHLNFETGYNVENFKRGVEIRKARNSTRNRGSSFNKLLLKTVGKMERGFSNGETALMKLSELLEKPGLYLLDEPENSMSCEFQMKLADIIQYLARYGNCQFLISSHSPFILSMENAKIYNLDHNPVDICKWWQLDNMKRYFQLFHQAKDLFLR
ncbi:MAG: AAA family ATPase [Muribaculaceae bacterium]|nr:AAA family ATPase [Muribaculaceae bacterium]MDE6755237.1 AAA family ATPase [Muribaculaceae bacterium]